MKILLVVYAVISISLSVLYVCLGVRHGKLYGKKGKEEE